MLLRLLFIDGWRFTHSGWGYGLTKEEVVEAETKRGLVAFIHAEQQLQAQSNTRVPPERKDADVACHNWRPQEVLH